MKVYVAGKSKEKLSREAATLIWTRDEGRIGTLNVAGVGG
jgi:hypothetical protein